MTLKPSHTLQSGRYHCYNANNFIHLCLGYSNNPELNFCSFYESRVNFYKILATHLGS